MFKKVLFATLLPVLAWAIVPRTASDVLIPSISGPAINLRMFKGKVLAVAIVSTTCKECMETVQVLARLQKDLGPRGFQPIIVVGDDNSKATARPFAQRYGLTMPVGYLTRDDIIKVANIVHERPAAPILLFIDKQSSVRVQYYGDNAFFKNTEIGIRSTVEDLLKK